MDLAFSANDPGVPANRWIASLSSGDTVFQNNLPGKPSAWIRLKDFLKKKNLHLTRLRYQTADGRMLQMPAATEVDGYWYMNKIRAGTNFQEVIDRLYYGVGYIKDDIIHITWVDDRGVVTNETRQYNPDDIGVLLHGSTMGN